MQKQEAKVTLVDMLVICSALGVAFALGKYFYRFVGWPALIPAWIILSGLGLLSVFWLVRDVAKGVRELVSRFNRKPD